MYADQKLSQKDAEYEKKINDRINTVSVGALAGIAGARRATPLEEMEWRNREIEQDHAKRAEGIQFLRDNPQFDKFIELIRKGSISI